MPLRNNFKLLCNLWIASKTKLGVGDAIFATIDRIELNPFAFKECVELPTKTKMYRTAACYFWSIVFKITSGETFIALI